MSSAEFKFDPESQQIVELVQQPVQEEDMESRLQEEADRAQNELNDATDAKNRAEADYAEVVKLVEQRSAELESARKLVQEREEELKSVARRRVSWAEAVALRAELAESRPEGEFGEDPAGGSEAVDVPVRVADEAPA